MIIDKKFQALIPPLTAEERGGLESNIVANGCLDTLKVWGDILVDGHNRFNICVEHGIEYKTQAMKFVDRNAVSVWIIRNQLDRRNIADFVRYELTDRQADILREQGRQKMEAQGKHGEEGGRGNIKTPLPIIGKRVSEESKYDTRKEIAKSLGWGHNKVAQAKTVKEQAPEPVKVKLRTGELSINQAYKEITREAKEVKRENRRQENKEKVSKVKLPTEIIKQDVRFATIVIDPPWDWGDENDNDQLGRAKPDYNTMSIEQLLELPVDKLSDIDCHLYLWITNRSLPKGFLLLEKWGFRYITALTWVKPSFGMGNYFRGQTEQVLFGVKGSQPLKRKDVGTVFFANRGENGHSSKPNEFYDIVESCSPGPFLEMFSRSKRNNLEKYDWIYWGENE